MALLKNKPVKLEITGKEAEMSKGDHAAMLIAYWSANLGYYLGQIGLGFYFILFCALLFHGAPIFSGVPLLEKITSFLAVKSAYVLLLPAVILSLIKTFRIAASSLFELIAQLFEFVTICLAMTLAYTTLGPLCLIAGIFLIPIAKYGLILAALVGCLVKAQWADLGLMLFVTFVFFALLKISEWLMLSYFRFMETKLGSSDIIKKHNPDEIENPHEDEQRN